MPYLIRNKQRFLSWNPQFLDKGKHKHHQPVVPISLHSCSFFMMKYSSLLFPKERCPPRRQRLCLSSPYPSWPSSSWCTQWISVGTDGKRRYPDSTDLRRESNSGFVRAWSLILMWRKRQNQVGKTEKGLHIFPTSSITGQIRIRRKTRRNHPFSLWTYRSWSQQPQLWPSIMATC